MNWLVTIVMGGIVGWVASKVMSTDAQMGIFANIIVGIAGAAIGFWLAGLLGLSATGPIVGWIVAVIGAMLLIFVLKKVGFFK